MQKAAASVHETQTTAALSHTLKLVDALLRVALADLPQRLVLVSARLHVLGVEHVVLRLLAFVSGLGQLGTQGLRSSRSKQERVKVDQRRAAYPSLTCSCCLTL